MLSQSSGWIRVSFTNEWLFHLTNNKYIFIFTRIKQKIVNYDRFSISIVHEYNTWYDDKGSFLIVLSFKQIEDRQCPVDVESATEKYCSNSDVS